MSPLPLLLLLVLQLSWHTKALEEIPNELADEEIAAIEAAGGDLTSANVQLDLLQGVLRNWDSFPTDVSPSIIGKVCRTIMDLKVIQPRWIPDVERMNLLFHQDACRNVSIPLAQANDLWTTPGFSSSKPTVIFITGWGSNITNSNSGPVAKAYACRNDTNFVVLDAADFIQTIYTWSALNTETIGRYLAQALMQLNRRYVTRNVHLVGHSLGAQIAGAAGRNFKELTGGATLARVTGLDPANPCFYDGKSLPGTRSGDARYVDIIYTNPGVAGALGEYGDGNFYVEGLSPIKSSCKTLGALSCSHQRAVDYYVESVYPTNTQNFKGRSCRVFANLLTGLACSRVRTAVMGYAATRSGLYYVDANKEEPFGTDADPATFTSPSNSRCGACNA